MDTSNGPREVPACNKTTGQAVRPVFNVRCPCCAGTGWIETGFSYSNVGSGRSCRSCYGTGFVEQEVRDA